MTSSEAAIALDDLIRPQIQGLIGVGAGLNKIVVYLRKKASAPAGLPTVYEGFPVETRRIEIVPGRDY